MNRNQANIGQGFFAGGQRKAQFDKFSIAIGISWSYSSCCL